MSRLAAMTALTLGTLAASFFSDAAPTAWAQEPQVKTRKVQKTDAQWSKLLTREQFLVTRKGATEPAFTGKYASHHARGAYHCVCCEAELFSSRTKFESGTGWPSFFQPVNRKQIETHPDYSMPEEARVEVLCVDCGAHLGHVFSDGPPPTGLRYCINSASLKFKPYTAAKKETTDKTDDEGTTPSKSKTAKGKTKSKARGKATGRGLETPGTEPETPKEGERP